MAFTHLLAPGRIGGLETRNRLVMAPMGSNLAEASGHVGERLINYYEARARGGVGMIIVGVGAVAFPSGVCIPNQVAISDDRFLPGLQELTRRLHAHGAKVAIQLQHGGKVARQDMEVGRPMWVPSVPELAAGDLRNDLTPAEIQGLIGHLAKPGAAVRFHEMTRADIQTLIGLFADSAERVRRAGFDGVEIHAAHGYLLAAFLSPAANHRTDDYGGPLENRARLLVQVLRAVKQRVGADFPVWCRLDGMEFHIDNGITPAAAGRTAEMAVAAGADAIHVSAYADPRSGVAFTEAPLVHQPCGYVSLAEGIKDRVSVPVIVVGRIAPGEADALIAAGKADFVAMARKLLADPELANKLAAGVAEDIRPCTYGYTCVGNIFLNRSVSCAVNPATGREAEFAIKVAARRRRVLIAGGGPAGMEAARLATLRGHRVTLCERAERLGGMALAAARVYAPNAALVDYLTTQIRRLPIDLRLGEEATPALVRQLQPDVVVVAVGAQATMPAIPGIDRPNVVHVGALAAPAWQPSSRVVVIGASSAALETAEYCSEHGASVSLLAETATLGVEMALPRRWRALHTLRSRPVQLLTEARIEAITDDGVVYYQGGGRQTVAADLVIVALPGREDRRLADALTSMGVEVHRLGDCRGPAGIEGAFLDATRVALEL